MHARERIIRERFTGQSCGHCGTPYPAEGILVLARRPTTWMVMASCHTCQNRSIFVVSFHDTRDTPSSLSVEPSAGAHLFPEAIITPDPDDPDSDSDPHPSTASADGGFHTTDTRPPSRNPVTVAVTVSDVADMHEFLSGFSGDFQALFERQRQRRVDDGAGE